MTSFGLYCNARSPFMPMKNFTLGYTIKNLTNLTMAKDINNIKQLITASSIKEDVNNLINQTFAPDPPDKTNELIYLQVELDNVPQLPVKNLKIFLKHNIVPLEPKLLLIAPDTIHQQQDETANAKNIELYQQVLKINASCKNISLMPLHQFRTEYRDQEKKNKLLELYDMTLIDFSIHHIVLHFFPIFTKARNKLFNTVRLYATNLQGEVNKALKQSHLYKETSDRKDYCYSMQIGTLALNEDAIVENILAAIDGLVTKIPHIINYFKSVQIKTATGSAVRVYDSNDCVIEVPVIKKEEPEIKRANVLPIGTYVFIGPQNKPLKRELDDDEESDVSDKKPKIKEEIED